MAGIFAWLRRKKKPEHLLDGPDMYCKTPMHPQYVGYPGGATAKPKDDETQIDSAGKEGNSE